MAEGLQITDLFPFAEGEHWVFAIGLCGDRWLGLARAREGPYLHVMAEVSERYRLGLPADKCGRARALAIASAVVLDDEACWGEVERWFVPPGERGDPEALRCGSCGSIGCDGRDCADLGGDWDDGEEPGP